MGNVGNKEYFPGWTAISALRETLDKAWCAETSAEPDVWASDNPARGQCAVTALVVQDAFGGDLAWASVQFQKGKALSHYFNLIDGVPIDITRDQFPNGTAIPAEALKDRGFPSTRDYVLSFGVTRARYELLKHRLASV